MNQLSSFTKLVNAENHVNRSFVADGKRCCDMCIFPNPAVYDAKTSRGMRADLCEKHFQLHGIGLGVGKGSRL